MPLTPADYNSLGTGLQLGLQARQQDFAKQEAQQALAERVRAAQADEAVKAGELGIQQAAEQRSAQLFQQQQEAGKEFQENLADEQEQNPDLEPTVHARNALARTLAKYPAAQIPGLLNATEVGGYREGIVNARQAAIQQRAETAEKTLAERSAAHAAQVGALNRRIDELTRHHQELEKEKTPAADDGVAHKVLDEDGQLIGHKVGGQFYRLPVHKSDPIEELLKPKAATDKPKPKSKYSIQVVTPSSAAASVEPEPDAQ
jgi:uncharacterized protein